jgi:drug/metabolite transporter (DMT)-like permease
MGYLILLFSIVLGALTLNEPVGLPKIIAAFFILLGLGLKQKAQANSLVQR